MSSTINFGIDLGTTNSLIAKCSNGVVEVFKNPIGHRETLPSVVGFRKERILVGEKAKEYVEKDAANVFASFKRKMGTSENFFVPNLGDFKSPIQLSSMVLNELKNFIYTGEVPQSVVITIPASFDTVQSNATKQAGYDAGFKEVILLQEPIAASLAFVNKGAEKITDGQWLVYDLGGGTFDVALVKVEFGEMKVIDHEGNNYLGGLDFDNLIIEQLIVPEIEKLGSFADILNNLKSSSGKYNKLYYELLYKAEEAKIILSSSYATEIEFEIEDDNGKSIDALITIQKEDFNTIIQPKVLETIAFTKTIIERNQLKAGDVKETILIGGSTYIPLVRSLLQKELGVDVNASVDPTTAVAIGAAYYAGTKSSNYEVASNLNVVNEEPAAETLIEIKTAYQKNTNEREEYFSAIISGEITGLQYRIMREDGGFDSGLKPVTTRIEEVLNLLPDTLNVFHLKVYNAQNTVAVKVAPIQIVQGKFSIYGQPLPNDICLEVDDVYNNTTHLELIFEKNAILPIKKTITKTISRTIVKGSDDQLLINVLEGSRYATAQSNLSIGVIAINGKDLETDLIKGSDVDLSIEITESRDIKITAYINVTDQEYAHVFSPTSRTVNTHRLLEEVDYLLRIANRNIDALVEAEDYESSGKMQDAIEKLEVIKRRLKQIKEDDVTDEKYQLDEQKRRLAQVVDASGKDNRVRELKEDYFAWKSSTEYYLEQIKNEVLNRKFQQIIAAETDFLNGSEASIKRKTEELRSLTWEIRKKDLEYVTGIFLYYAFKEDAAYKDPKRVKQLKERGDAAIERKSVDELLNLVYQMYELLIDKQLDEPLKGTGLS